MRKSGVCVLFCLVLTILPVPGISSDVSEREEALIYSILAFNGRDYTKTFCREESRNIYLIAESDNYVILRKTLVYFWPLSGKWLTDTDILNVPFEGILEIWKGKKMIREIDLTQYALYSVEDEYEMSWRISVGSEAETVVREYRDSVESYRQALAEYEYKKAVIENTKREIAEKIARAQEDSEEAEEILDQLNELSPGEPPEEPDDYVMPPVRTVTGYHINLPSGEYRLRFRTSEGLIMQGSEKNLKVYSAETLLSAGFEIIPGDKWTSPVESNSPYSVIYVNGETDLYIQGFRQTAYNDFFHEKTVNSSGMGNPVLSRPVRVQQIPGLLLEIEKDGSPPDMIREQPFRVEQTEGGEYGYTIESAGQEEPNIIAFPIPLEPGDRAVTIRLKDKDGRSLKGGVRKIRVVTPSRRYHFLLIPAAVPLGIWGLVMVRRKIKRKDEWGLSKIP